MGLVKISGAHVATDQRDPLRLRCGVQRLMVQRQGQFHGREVIALKMGRKSLRRKAADVVVFNLETAVDRFVSLAKPHEIER